VGIIPNGQDPRAGLRVPCLGGCPETMPADFGLTSMVCDVCVRRGWSMAKNGHDALFVVWNENADLRAKLDAKDARLAALEAVAAAAKPAAEALRMLAGAYSGRMLDGKRGAEIAEKLHAALAELEAK